MGQRGFFEVAVYHPKTETNIGTLWRTADQLGAAGLSVIGKRYRHQSSDTGKAPRRIPLRQFLTLEEWWNAIPFSCVVVGVEMGGSPLSAFTHPERAIYLLGAEDHGLPPAVLAKCHCRVSLEAVARESYNLAMAGGIILYDRVFPRTIPRDQRKGARA